jgi:hypothetical protein
LKAANRKIISLLFLLPGLAPLLFVLFVSLQKQSIRQEMREKLKAPQQFETIILPENEVKWMDKHEIWVNEQMFDIHTKKLVNGVYTFTGLYDDDETELVKKQQGTTEKEKQQNKLLSNLFKCLHTIFYTQPADFNFVVKRQENKFCRSLQQLATQSKEILTPPPQV